MRIQKSIFSFALFICAALANSYGQNPDFNLNAKLPIDPTMRTGVLANGMHYYIRKNAKPEHRAEMWLVENAGSVLENDSQQGLAHLTEHMCFNGTKNFSKSAIVDYLESVGMRFGADLNAYTSYDETVYMLEVPTDTEKFIKTGLQIIEDWAHNVSFEPVEIDKERGVVIEEWRLGRGAFERMSRQINPVIYPNSLYAKRNPIGLRDVVAHCKYDTLTKFYHDWYRPDLQAVVVVGDFDLDQMEQRVKEQFSRIPAVKNPRPRTYPTIEPHRGTIAAVATDKESQYVLLQIENRRAKRSFAVVKDYRDHIKEQLFSQMVNARLEELQHKSPAPFAYASTDIGSALGQASEYQVVALAPDNDIAGSLKTLIDEQEKVRRFGFTASELERAKKVILEQIESSYKEKDKTESKSLTQECVRHFLAGEDIAGIANDYAFFEKFVPEITLTEVNATAREWISNDNCDIVVEAPDKAGIKVPTQTEILAIADAAKTDKLEAYQDNAASDKLMDKMPTAGKVVKETTNKETGTTEWTLSNGAHVVLKPTDFKEDEILFGAFSPGGTSLVSNEDYVTCTNAPSIVDECGIASFDANTLAKMLAGKKAGVSPYISDLYERFNGSASPKDIETMLQLTYLYFTNPKEDKEGFGSYLSKEKSFAENQTLSPEGVLRDSNQLITSNYNFRRRPVSVQTLNEINESKVLSLYKERFGNARNFTFFFVGNFKPEDLKPLVETYIGGLPATHKKERWKNPKIGFPKGIVKKYVRKGTEPKSYVAITMKTKFKWNLKNKVDLEATTQVLDIMLREVMREDKSGVYGVGVYLVPSRYPGKECTVYIQFGCAPENVDMLVQTAFDQVKKLQKEGPSAQNMSKTTEIMHRSRETSMKDNSFWLNVLQGYTMNGDNISDIMKYDATVNKLTPEDVKKAASKYFDFDNYVEVVLVPEK